jgi:hypothetical protein
VKLGADRAEQVPPFLPGTVVLAHRLGPALLPDREVLRGRELVPGAQGNLRGQRQQPVKMPRLDGELRVTTFPSGMDAAD